MQTKKVRYKTKKGKTAYRSIHVKGDAAKAGRAGASGKAHGAAAPKKSFLQKHGKKLAAAAVVALAARHAWKHGGRELAHAAGQAASATRTNIGGAVAGIRGARAQGVKYTRLGVGRGKEGGYVHEQHGGSGAHGSSFGGSRWGA